MPEYTNSEIRRALVDIIHFHDAVCKEPECELKSSEIWEAIFKRLQIPLTDEELNTIRGKNHV